MKSFRMCFFFSVAAALAVRFLGGSPERQSFDHTTCRLRRELIFQGINTEPN